MGTVTASLGRRPESVAGPARVFGVGALCPLRLCADASFLGRKWIRVRSAEDDPPALGRLSRAERLRQPGLTDGRRMLGFVPQAPRRFSAFPAPCSLSFDQNLRRQREPEALRRFNNILFGQFVLRCGLHRPATLALQLAMRFAAALRQPLARRTIYAAALFARSGLSRQASSQPTMSKDLTSLPTPSVCAQSWPSSMISSSEKCLRNSSYTESSE